MINQSILKDQLKKLPVTVENGTAFYKSLFTAAPHVRAFFKGSENINPNDVPASERFHKQGLRLLTSVHVLVETAGNPHVFNAYTDELVNKHRTFKMEFAHYEAFWPLFFNFLQEYIGMNAAERSEWEKLAAEFLKETKKHLATIG